MKGVLADCPRDTVAILVGNRFSRWARLLVRLSLRFDIILTTKRGIIGDLERYRRRRRNNVFGVMWKFFIFLMFLMLFYICIMVSLIHNNNNNNKNHYHIEL